MEGKPLWLDGYCIDLGILGPLFGSSGALRPIVRGPAFALAVPEL